MSTRIDDLPGPIDEELIDDLSQIQNDINQNPRQINELVDQNQTNVKMNINKRVRFKDENDYKEIEEFEVDEEDTDLFQYIKSQFSEENVLIFVMLMIASRKEFDNYMTKLPFVSNYISESSIMTSILKAILLLIVYILFKRYILSSVKM